MATSTITGTITGPTGVAVASARVVCRLMPTGGFRSADGSEVARNVETTTNGSGVYTLVLERNSGITPDNTYYQITEYIPTSNGGPKVWNISVGASNQTVLAALVTPLAAQPSTYLTQASADARYQALSALGSSTPGTETPDHAGTAGVSTSASRADHIHPVATGAPTNVGLAGTNSEGSATDFARSTHVHAYNPPACRVYNSTSLVLADATWTALTFNTDRWDTSAMHDTSTNTSRITVPTAGLYHITGHIQWGNNAVGERLLAIRVNNGTDVATVSLFGTAGATSGLMKSISTVWKLAANDYVELRAYQNCGGNLTILASVAQSPEFAATWIGVG